MILADAVCDLKKHLQMCFSRSALRFTRDQKANEPLDAEPLQSEDVQEPDLETVIILGTDLAVVLTCPQKLAVKLQGEEASREDQQGKYEESLSQALNLSKAAQRLEIIKNRPIFRSLCGNRGDEDGVFVHIIQILSPLTL